MRKTVRRTRTSRTRTTRAKARHPRIGRIMGTKWTEEQYKKAQIRRENKQLILGTGAAIRERFNLEMWKESPRPYLDAIIAGELVKIIMKRSALWEKETNRKLADIGEDKLGYLL